MKTHVGITSVLRRYYVGIFALGLAACSASAPVAPGTSYRDPSVLIGVTTRYDEARFAGEWRVRAALPAGAAVDAIRFEDRATGLQIQMSAFTCDPAGVCATLSDTLRVDREGAGRYVIEMPDGERRRMWVLWVDEGFRTAAIGNPDGSFAWILDRAATGGADRIVAAREILDFNGYDLSQLKVKE